MSIQGTYSHFFGLTTSCHIYESNWRIVILYDEIQTLQFFSLEKQSFFKEWEIAKDGIQKILGNIALKKPGFH